MLVSLLAVNAYAFVVRIGTTVIYDPRTAKTLASSYPNHVDSAHGTNVRISVFN
jgi:hypothetical protein